MCSPLLIPGSSITFRVSFVEVHPKVPLVRLWGLPGERREEYLRLMKDIQMKVGPRLANAPGDRGGRGDGDNDGQALALGDLCLVELGGRWHRCRIVSCRAKPGQNYRVFLLDEGRTVLNLSNGNEEIVNPIHVWNGIPELDSDLTQITSKNKTDILHSVPATILAMEVGEMTHDSDDSTND